MKETSTQSSVVRNRSSMQLNRATICGKRASTRPQPSSLALCSTTSKRSTCSPLVYALSVNLPKCNLNTVRSYTGVSSTTSNELMSDLVEIAGDARSEG